MKILVAYKRVVDYNVRIQVKPDGSGVVTDGVKLSPNPFDEIALEEALRLRDKGIATEVVVATIAPADAQAHLRNGLAMGANRAIHVVTDQAIQPLTAARTLLKLVEKEQPDLVILAGFMRILDAQFVAAFADRLINTHPALLPSFPGAHGVRDALAHGVKVTGCTVHYVDAGLDSGRIIAQRAVEVDAGDTEAELHERIKKAEREQIVELLHNADIVNGKAVFNVN